jgi:hypothetical protein
MKIIICQRCGEEVKVSHRNSNRQKYCKECAVIIRREQVNNYYQENKNKKKRGEKLCSCGCGRPVGEGLHFLSEYCYQFKHNDVDEECKLHIE